MDSSSRGTLEVLASRDLRAYLLARFLATLAIQMLGTVLGFQVYELTHRTLDLGLLGLSQFLPIALLSLPAGTLADRVDRRAVLFACDLVFALAAFGLYFFSRFPHPPVLVFFVLSLVLGVGRAFYGPSGSALLPSLVPREHLASAVAWQTTSWQLAAIGGPSMGGLLYALGKGPGPVYALSTLGFVVAGLCLAWIRVPQERRERAPISPSELLAGVTYIRKNQLLLGSITLDFLAVFLGGATALLPVFATEVLHVGPTGLGALRAAPALGAGVTASYFALYPMGRNTGNKMLAGVAIFGAATLVFGYSRSFVVSLLALAVLGAADMVSAVVRGTLLQMATPEHVRGRVSAVNLVFIGASNELGEFESGTLAALIGAVPCVLVGGAGTLFVVALWAWLFPSLRAIDRLEEVKPAE